ncbi:uncharacterized protein EV420DRAFT_1638396 [Desarmillaria tabescens]|uniref:F-box domain-containing protein n=1 Tax=Armillaria tabescens TaxID=1929756 RepID=A0AA39ND80_ARMTA|nr:uncharacterized protein EV420DRAFT_1638396 [Desarmillaria tabescens]KAK0463460.1 hypothetical protein EV420DRAFT_1638396 [Desarmillaria tabescens]
MAPKRPRVSNSACPPGNETEDPTKQKPKATRARGRLGHLEGLMDMPVDVWYEIYAHLHPLDLLHLARSTKAFRTILMSKSSLFVWKVARISESLPDPRPGFSEPVWVNLLYEAICHICNKNISRTIDFEFGARLCSKCYEDEKNIMVEDDIHVDGTSAAILSMVPYKFGTRKPHKHKIIYLKRDVDKVKARLISLPEDQREAYSQQQRFHVKEVLKRVKACDEWIKKQSRNREKELIRLRDERKSAIYKKLVDLGYEEDLKSIRFPDSLEEHRLVKQTRPLTEKVWDNIRDEMVAFMDAVRVKRISRERRARIFSNSYSLLRPTDIQKLVVKNILELPSEVVVDIQTFDDVIPELPSLFREWRERVHDELLRVSGHPNPSSLTTLDQKIQWLELARNVFICKGPFHIGHQKILFYPGILSHVCCTVEEWSEDMSLTEPHDKTIEWVRRKNAWVGLYDDMWYRRAWNAEHLFINPRLNRMTADLIRCLGFDPDTATVQNLDEPLFYYRCKICAKKGEPGDAEIYGWRALPDDFEKLTVQSVKKNKKLKKYKMDVDDRVWCCVHCRDLPSEVYPTRLSKIRKHLDDEHSITEPIINQDYYENLGAAPSHSTFRCMQDEFDWEDSDSSWTDASSF